jgi:hypothetical protein
MLVSSETPRLAGNASQVLFTDQSGLVEVCDLEDEEFPLDLPAHYDWMLQHSSRLNYRRVVAVIAVIATLLIALSVLIAYSSSNVPRAVLVSPVYSPHRTHAETAFVSRRPGDIPSRCPFFFCA